MRYLLLLTILFSAPTWAMRIISTSPALTEMVSLLGHEKDLVGVTPFCLDASAAIKIGTALELDFERVLSLKPDVILLQENTPGRAHQDLKKLGLNVMSFSLITLDDIAAAWAQLSKLLNSKNDFLSRQLARLEKLKGQGKIAIILGGVPGKNLMLAGSGTYYHDILTRSGFNNAATGSGWPLIDAEQARTLATGDILFFELVSEAKKGWNAKQWQEFCGACRVRIIKEARALYPGPKMLERMIDQLEQIHD